MGVKKVVNETISTVINESGEILGQSESITYNYLEVEPEYVKLYTKDILKLKNIPNASNSVLLAIMRRLGYNNEIGLYAPIKRQIAEELGLSVKKIEQAIQEFAQKDILLRKDRGLYVVNPYYFGKGKWQDIKKLRLTIEYSPAGRSILKTAINEEQEQLAIEFDNSKINNGHIKKTA